MPVPNKTTSRSRKSASIRQSVTIPAALATEARRLAKERHLTVSRALVVLAERGVRAERDAKEGLKATYQRFIRESDTKRKNKAGKDLIRAIFGNESIAED